MNRRAILKALFGGAIAMSAGGIALLEAEPIIRTYFLPPKGGWLGGKGRWELACAQEALRVLNEKLARFDGHNWDWPVNDVRLQVVTTWGDSQLQAALARQARLQERVDKLARGWTGFSARYSTLLDGRVLTVHGGRSPHSKPLANLPLEGVPSRGFE